MREKESKKFHQTINLPVFDVGTPINDPFSEHMRLKLLQVMTNSEFVLKDCFCRLFRCVISNCLLNGEHNSSVKLSELTMKTDNSY